MVLPQSSQTFSSVPQVFRLSTLQSYSTWGELLTGIRKHNDLTQHQIATESKPYFIKTGLPILKPRIYGDMERGRRAPYFGELEPLFRTFVEACGVGFSDLEISAYVHLAKERIAQKSKRKDRVNDAQWEELTETLFLINNSKRGQKIHLLKDEPAPTSYIPGEEPNSRRLKAVERAINTDTSHLLEREKWLAKMLAYLKVIPQAKLVVVQGHMGIGKSHASALLIQHLVKEPEYYLIPYLFEAGSSKTPEDHLEVFLATLTADLMQTAPTDDVRQKSLEERIDLVISALKKRDGQGQKVIVLLDDAQAIFPSALAWSPAWTQFFETLVREPHTSTFYMMTRTWPGWQSRRLSYVEELELPELTAEASISIWQRKGFDNVPEDLLREVSRRCGYNPQLIEMAISQCQRRSWSFTWSKSGSVSSRTQKNSNAQRLEDLLAQDTIFDTRIDVKAQTILQHSIASRLSHQATQMLECLTLSPLGLPFTLLMEEFVRAEEAFNELVNASAVNLNEAISQRAALVPLVREAQYQSLLSDGRKDSINQRVTDLYAYWLSTLQDFRDDSEKAGLIAEMVVRYIKQRQLLRAVELFIDYGWLCTLFGHITRIKRVFDEMVKEDRGQEEDINHEIGRLILQHRIAVHNRQKIERNERDQLYQSIYEKIIAGEIALQPHSELEVLHNMRLLHTRNAQYTEAKKTFDNALERLQQSGQTHPEIYASFLYDKAQLFLSWSEKYDPYSAETMASVQEAASILRECISQWRLCSKKALPLQEHYISFKLARALNDYAYALRELGRYQEAQQAIEESIHLKKLHAALPHSIAIAQSELSQILLQQGMIRQGKILNEEAVHLLEYAIENGDSVHQPELGMVLIERADILCQQAQLAEALPLLERAIQLIGDKPSRQHYKQKAIKQIEEIRLISNSGHSYQLDRRWFPRYSEAVAYDDLLLLTQAGPFTDDEQEEWIQLFLQRDKEKNKNRLLELAAQSRKREFIRSLQLNCAPAFSYPCISVEDLQERSQGLGKLRQDIEKQERNAIVRRLYLDAIDEHLTTLVLIQAIALQNQEMVWECNLKLYGKPLKHEVKIALQALCAKLLAVRDHYAAGAVARELLGQLRGWGISVYDVVAEELYISQQETTQQTDRRVLASEKKQFPSDIVRKFFKDVLSTYGAKDWKVSVSPARDYTYVDPSVRELVLPQKSFTLAKIRQLLAEEIETHTFRALAGQHSPFALLGLGLARQDATEEGLAKEYIKHVYQAVGVQEPENTWIGTLAIGLAAGIITPALSFQELRNFLEKYYLFHRLLTREESQEDALTAARQSAWSRTCRTFRGVPDLNLSGCCSLKDGIYLRGHLEVSRFFAQGEEEQRLWVGAVGVEHLNDLAELNILTPTFPHRHFALAPDLLDQLEQYTE